MANSQIRNSTPRIMVVDDEDDIILELRVVLEGNGFKVDSFNDALLALENFKADLYDLLILDIKMPKMNGFELYKQIKKVDNKVKTMFLTALTELQEYEEFRKEVSPKLGERYFVPKPIENEDLIKRVNKILSQIENN
ncbi:MAG TPA: response regulator [Nitrososphaeraceae archaeon]|jgi:DNA-binding response OmpR family regulator|nr:response regulator [Nitrososphaeraceae archaeon]